MDHLDRQKENMLAIQEKLYEHVHCTKIMARREKHGIQIEDANKVDWEANEEAIQAIPIH